MYCRYQLHPFCEHLINTDRIIAEIIGLVQLVVIVNMYRYQYVAVILVHFGTNMTKIGRIADVAVTYCFCESIVT